MAGSVFFRIAALIAATGVFALLSSPIALLAAQIIG
jgi:hypothetical protein